MLGAAVAVSSLIALDTGGKSIAAPIAPTSDELQVRGPTGGLLYDQLIQDTAGSNTEQTAFFSATGFVPSLVAPGDLPAYLPPGTPGLFYVILSEPPTEPIDPTELPPVTYSGPNGPVVVSDLLINTLFSGVSLGVALISDNNTDLATYLAAIPTGTSVPILSETGGLQDVSAQLNPAGPTEIFVRSDVIVPEPSSIVILLGFAGIGVIGSTWRRRSRRAVGPAA